MARVDQLQAEARKCRRLASGLSNRDDVRTLEAFAIELEERARAAGRTGYAFSR